MPAPPDPLDFSSLPQPVCSLTCRIGNDPEHGFRMTVTEGDNGKACVTLLRILQKDYFQGRPVSLVLLEPLTGRRHQACTRAPNCGRCHLHPRFSVSKNDAACMDASLSAKQCEQKRPPERHRWKSLVRTSRTRAEGHHVCC
mmetsp:Transcript_27890/g.43528  ORF Transcript_27890/g.43528 Transcript_27890/m.43528 type:complete len:142 (+) Transcript_27890:1607-2032(+)